MEAGRQQPSCYSSLLLVHAYHPVSSPKTRNLTHFCQNQRTTHLKAQMSWPCVLILCIEHIEHWFPAGFKCLRWATDPRLLSHSGWRLPLTLRPNGCTWFLIVDEHCFHFTFELLDHATAHNNGMQLPLASLLPDSSIVHMHSGLMLY